MAQSSPRRTSIFHESDDGSLHNSIDLSPSPSPSHMNHNLKHEQFEKIYKIFRKPKEERDEEDFEFVKSILKTIPFFLEQQREDINFDEFLYKVYTLMNFQSFRKNEAIFHHGERGTNFYLILKGYVDVYVPKDQHELAKEVKQKVESNLKSMPRVSLAQKRRGTSNSMTRTSRLSVGGNNETDRRTSVFLGPRAAEKPDERSPGMLKNFKSMQKIVKESSYVLENFTEHQDLYMKNGVPKFKKLRNLGPGQVFGEQALSSDADVCRDNTRVAATNVHMIVFSKASWKKLFEGLEKRLNVKSDFFGNLTGQTSKEAIVKFCGGFEERSYKYGQVVFSQGQMPGEIFVIREGEIQISRHDMQDEGQDMIQRLRKTKKNIVEKKIVNVRPPHFFGEGEAVLNQPYEYTAKSISNDTVVYVLSIGEFQSLKREYPDVWNGILAKYHTKMPHWKSRHSHVSKVKERLEEEQVAMRRTFSSNSNSNSSYDSSNSPNMMPTEDSHAGSAILNKKSKFKLDIKISSNKDMSVNSDSSKKEYPLTERQSTSKSILHDLDSPMPEKDIGLTLSPARRDSYSSLFGGGKQINEIVESKFKILKRQSFQKPEMTDTATFPDEIEDISLVRRSSQKKITRVATDKSLPKVAHSDEVIVPKNALNSPRSPIKLKPYEVDLAKSKIKGLNIPLLSLRTEPSVATLSPKHHKNSSSGVPTSRFLHEKLPTLGDTPKAKGPKFFSYKFTDDDYGSKQGSPRATESHKGTIGTIPDSLSPRALASIKLNPLSHRPTEHTLYKAEEINYNIAEYELNAPFSTRRGALALAINSFKTCDMVYGMQEVYQKSLVAPEALNPVIASPKSARVKPTMLHKMNPMLPSQHNMFRVKPNRAHIIMDLYKGEQESPKGKRSKK